jgi:hypothetical protein
MSVMKVISTMYPGVVYAHQADADGTWTLQDIEYNNVECDSDAINAALDAEEAATQYQRDRVMTYPSIGEQLDMIFHAGLGGDEFQAAIQAVKDAYPKPE